ncbi:MAG: hypothetical protein M1829_004532 [Trizodia sp. TS-e1964]|nr:MAG: hypothetical protein M1829_004532 [Trizodia sp. TS-e1964]
MPSRLGAPVLSVDAAKMHKVDTRNAENLFGMWTVFSKCAESIEEGRRLENLSWRLWNRETFCCASSEDSHSTTPAITVAPRTARLSHSSHDSMPELSASVDSASASDEDEPLDRHCRPADSSALHIAHPPTLLRRMDSFESRSRGREKHITSLVLEKMVTTIKEKKHLEPLPGLFPSPPAAAVERAAQPSPPPPAIVRTVPTAPTGAVERALSPPSLSPCSPQPPLPGSPPSSAISDHSIVRGFSPGQSSSYRSLLRPVPTPSPGTRAQLHAAAEQQKKKNGMFLLGASSGEDESSLEEHMSFKGRRKSLADVLRTHTPNRKQTSFKDEVSTRTIKEDAVEDEDVFTDDSDEDVVSESAIDDDDSDEWEDSVDENNARPGTIDEKLFQRVDSRPVLASRPSLLTNLLHQSERQIALATAATAAAAHKSAPNLARKRNHAPTGPASPSPNPDSSSSGASAVPTMRGPDIPRTKAMVIPPAPTLSPALSPRTTRRNMLATEFTESLRRHLLWERQQKNTTVAAVLKRRHTAHDVSNLNDYPGHTQPVMKDSKDASRNNSWNHYFDHGLGEYHQKGW